ncbi:MAG: ribokinase [Velocimicrobium sp.]
MKVLNFGSLNYDIVYQVEHVVMPGETIASKSMKTFCGGKGLNQSVALAKAGANVFHAGMVGQDGDMLLQTLEENDVNIGFVEKIEGKSGHAIIQLDKQAQNCILLYGGANRLITKEYVDKIIRTFEKGDILLLQNEINELDYIIDRAYEQGMCIVLNPSPFDEALNTCDLNKVSIFVLNEIEGAQISGKIKPEDILNEIHIKYPESKVVLTLGKDGAVYSDDNEIVKQPIFPTKAVDTTAAGDTFTGYFIAGLMEEKNIAEIMKQAAMASSIAVSRMGAAPSIPYKGEVYAKL